MTTFQPPQEIPAPIVRARRIAGALLVVATLIVLVGLIMVVAWQSSQVEPVY